MESLRKGPLRNNLSRKNSSPVQSRTRTISDHSARPNYSIRKTSTEYKDRGLIVPSTKLAFHYEKQPMNNCYPGTVKDTQLVAPYQPMHYESMIARPSQLYNDVGGQRDVMNNFSFSKQERGDSRLSHYAPPSNLKTAIRPIIQRGSQSDLHLESLHMYNRTYTPPQSPPDNTTPSNFNGNKNIYFCKDIGSDYRYMLVLE